jgi:hypothetical protein
MAGALSNDCLLETCSPFAASRSDLTVIGVAKNGLYRINPIGHVLFSFRWARLQEEQKWNRNEE